MLASPPGLSGLGGTVGSTLGGAVGTIGAVEGAPQAARIKVDSNIINNNFVFIV
jgi:hypothetical protein